MEFKGRDNVQPAAQAQEGPAFFTPDIPPPVRATRTPGQAMPPGACDCHAHVFGPPLRRLLLPDTHFKPNECSLADYEAMLHAIGVQRAVLVQPSVYGSDNSLIEAALSSRQRQVDLRAVAVVKPTVTPAELQRLHSIGFRGVRMNTASATPGLTPADIVPLAGQLRALGWHLQLFVDLENDGGTEALLDSVGDLPVVIDHFGKVQARGGADSPAARRLLRAMARPNVWAKLMGPYFVSREFPSYGDTDWLARAMLDVAADRLLWATDWPHPSAREQMPNDGDLVDLLGRWIPDTRQRHAVLVDNPARLYGFGAH